MSAHSASGKPGGLDRISFIILQITLFLTPIFFIPTISMPLQAGRSAFMLYGITLAFIFWSLARLKDGVFQIPRSLFYGSAGVLALAYILSALFSANQSVSLAGTGLELGTLAFFLPSLVLFALVPLIVRTQKDIFYSYAVLLGSFFVVALFHAVRLIFGADALSFGMFTSATSNIIGKWNDLGIFFGLSALVSLITLERATLSKAVKIAVYVSFVISLIMLVVVNFSPVWITLAVLSLVFIVYKLSFDREHGNLGARVPYHALIVLIMAVVFAFAGGKISSIIADSLGTSQVEVRPSWSATYEIAKSSLKDNPLWGVGPNRFSSEWLMHKPNGINDSLFWNVDFNYGIGFIPSFISTTGLVGFLAALLFMVLFGMLALKALLRPSGSPFSRYLVLSSVFGSVYLWIFAFTYVPSAAIWILTLALSGLFVAAAREDNIVAEKTYSVLSRPAASFVAVLFTIVALIAAVTFMYFVTVKLFAGVYFQKGAIAISKTNDLDMGQSNIARAISLSPSDLYYRSISEIQLAKLGKLFQDDKTPQAEAQKQFQQILASGIQAAQAAVTFDPTNYQNYVAQGRVFEAVVPLNIEGSYESAKKAYETALTVNPESPEIYLVLARLEVAHKNNAAAKAYIKNAIEKKDDYADAFFLLAQIQIAENDVANAIESVTKVAMLSPTDPGLFFQLGLLYYNQKDYVNSTAAFERAITINAQYANAKYFLGLSYYQIGEKDRAINQFKEILATNPDNVELKSIIENLEGGRPPFTAPAPAQAVTKTPKLPVKQ